MKGHKTLHNTGNNTNPKVPRYQSGNENPLIDEDQTIQWAKYKGQANYLQHIPQKTKDPATRTQRYEDTKEVMRIRKSMKIRQYNGKTKRDKMTKK